MFKQENGRSLTEGKLRIDKDFSINKMAESA